MARYPAKGVSRKKKRFLVWFRIILALATAVSCALFFWFASHESSWPVILGRYSPAYFGFLVVIFVVAAVMSVVHIRPIYTRLFALRGKIVVLFLTIALSCVLLEVVVRVLDPIGISKYEWVAQYHDDKIADRELVFTHTPGLNKKYLGIEVSINDLGLRERPIGRKQEDEVRVLFLGDSVTFGWRVPVEQTFVRLLESRLSSRLGRPVRTVNSGVGGYNTVQEKWFLFRSGERIDPDLVVLLYVKNDIEVNSGPFDLYSLTRISGKSPPEAVKVLLSKSWLGRLVNHIVRGDADTQKPPGRESIGWKQSMDALRSIHGFCQDRAIPFVAFVYRMRASDRVEAALWETVSSLGRKEGFLVDDVKPWWGDMTIGELTLSALDGHPNAKGHTILADGMERFLVKSGVLEPLER